VIGAPDCDGWRPRWGAGGGKVIGQRIDAIGQVLEPAALPVLSSTAVAAIRELRELGVGKRQYARTYHPTSRVAK
jgi:hypothetical protein